MLGPHSFTQQQRCLVQGRHPNAHHQQSGAIGDADAKLTLRRSPFLQPFQHRFGGIVRVRQFGERVLAWRAGEVHDGDAARMAQPLLKLPGDVRGAGAGQNGRGGRDLIEVTKTLGPATILERVQDEVELIEVFPLGGAAETAQALEGGGSRHGSALDLLLHDGLVQLERGITQGGLIGILQDDLAATQQCLLNISDAGSCGTDDTDRADVAD